MSISERSAVLRKAQLLEVDAIKDVDQLVKQETGKEMDIELYVALLKLYQFYPSKANYYNICLVSLKAALLGMKSNAFSACLYLIPEKLFDKKELREIIRLNELLEKMCVEEIWSNVQSYVSLASSLGWTGAPIEAIVRQNIFDTVLLCHKRIPVRIFLELMHFESEGEMRADPVMQGHEISIQNDTLSFEGANNAVTSAKPAGDTMNISARLREVIRIIGA